MNVPGQWRVKGQLVSCPRTDSCGGGEGKGHCGNRATSGWGEKRAEETEKGQKPGDSCRKAEPGTRRCWWRLSCCPVLVRQERPRPGPERVSCVLYLAQPLLLGSLSFLCKTGHQAPCLSNAILHNPQQNSEFTGGSVPRASLPFFPVP